MTWTSWIGWTLGYAVVVWILHVLLALLEQPLQRLGLADLGQWTRFLVPLILAFGIAVMLRSWAWVLGPPLAIVLTMLTYPILDYFARTGVIRQQYGSGLIIAIFAISVDALFTTLATATGIAIGKWLGGR